MPRASIFDQMGVAPPYTCCSTRHDHDTPATGYTTGRRTALRHIADHMRNPHPSLGADALNYAAMTGLRFEIESRYRPDVAYLLDHRPPTPTDYEPIAYWPPDPALIDPDLARQLQRMRRMRRLMEHFADAVRMGCVQPTITAAGRQVRCAAYRTPRHVVVLLADLSPTPAPVILRGTDGYRVVAVASLHHEPDAPFSNLPPHGFRVLRLEPPASAAARPVLPQSARTWG